MSCHLSATQIITDRKYQHEHNLMKSFIHPACLWFILSSDSTKPAMHLAVLAPEVQSTDSMQPFGTAVIKVSVLWHSTLHLTVSQYLIPLSRMHTDGPSGSQVTCYTPWTDSWEFGQALICTTCWDGWTQPHSHIGKDIVWSAESLPGFYSLHCLGLHWVKQEFTYYNDVFTIWSNPTTWISWAMVTHLARTGRLQRENLP